MAKKIVSMIPAHRSYLEPFFGSGAVLFAKPPSAIETVNDLDGDITNFFRILREQPDRLAEAIAMTPYARDVFDDAHENYGTDDFDRAYRLAIRSKMGHGFKTRQKTGFKIDIAGRENAYAVRCWNMLPADLVAADYGAPTTRKRFVLIARCDGRPIVWPERTHAPRDSEEVKSGKLLPWRSAAEIIDWSVPAYSIFASKQEIKERYGVNAVRPLARNTLRRVIRGVDKFTIQSGQPFIVPMGYGERKGQAPRVNDIHDPLSTVVAKDKFGLCDPLMVPYTFSNTGGSVGADVGGPVHTIRTAGGQVLAATNLIQYHTEQTEAVRANGLDKPINTVDASNRYGLTCANLVETAHDREALVAAHVVEFKGQDTGQDMRRPLRTITASWGEFAECRTVLVKASARKNLGYWPQVRALLNEHCGYSLADDEVLLLVIRGTAYYIHDITLRMLTPRELYNAMGFPADYVIDRDYLGNAYPKSKTVARCGNAVCPSMAYAMVWANFPEWHGRKLTTMADFENAVAV